MSNEEKNQEQEFFPAEPVVDDPLFTSLNADFHDLPLFADMEQPAQQETAAEEIPEAAPAVPAENEEIIPVEPIQDAPVMPDAEPEISAEPAPDLAETPSAEASVEEPDAEAVPQEALLPQEEVSPIWEPEEQPEEHIAFSSTDPESLEEFNQQFQKEEPEETIPAHDRPARKGRPKRKKGEGLFGIPNILATGVWLALILAVGITLGRMLWVCAADVLAFGRENKVVTVTIYESDTIDDITNKLHEGGLIRYPGLFKLYASFAVDEGEIHPGIWDLNTLYDYHALVRTMSPSSNRQVVTVMIPEGYTCRQIFDLLQENKVCTVQDMEMYAANGDLGDYWFLLDVARGDKYCLEGYLFPDTYQFYQNDSPKNVLCKMLNNFESRISEEVYSQIAVLNDNLTQIMRNNGRSDDYIASHKLTLHEIITVASMVERETASAAESYTIASVIYNRLFDWGNNPAYLNIDASVIYALGGKSDLTTEDLQVDSPYNTYTNIGLTPGPIANPGLACITAALQPADTDYYYYVLDPAAGAHHFSRTLDEHEAFRASLRG